MKKIFFSILTILFLAPSMVSFGQKVYVSKSVLKTAEWANFKYKEVLDKSIAGDIQALTSFFKFNSAVDGVEAIDHNITCLELIPLATDDKVATALLATNHRLRKLVMDRLVLAQGKTQKTELKKPLESWAPKTWAIISNKPLPAPQVSTEEMTDKMKAKEAARTPTGVSLKADEAQPVKIDADMPSGGGKKQ